MLVTRQIETEQNPWSISKLETIFHKPTTSSRMSNFEAPLSTTQSDWQGHYSFLPPGDSGLFSHAYDHHHAAGSADNQDSHAAQPRSSGPVPTGSGLNIDVVPKTEPAELGSPISHRRSLDPLGLRQPKAPTPTQEHHAESQGDHYTQKAAESVHEESLASTETPGLSLGSNPLSSVSSAEQGPEIQSTQVPNESQSAVKEEDDDVVDDEEMLEGDVDGDGDGEGDAPAQPQTAAERTAARRKMKRFRLTHQQTRFLMSEFAKQPHPDAAHRERLSREIPGLSPRQVQVWFQNRRAKIKRLTADDRERMIKMRAVPDDFDNVGALHSPYGAVHALGAPMSSPVDFGGSPYGDPMMRGPLMVDVRRAEGDEHLSPTGLSPAFGNIGFNPSAGLNNPDILSPLSPGASDHRYGYSSHLSSPMGGVPRTSNPFARHNSIDASMHMSGHHSRQQIRPLQPLQLRETMTRSRSDNLQSPLRTSMSWKGDAIDYTTYHGSSQSPQLGGRQQSVYQAEQMGGSATSPLGSYESGTYSGSTVQSPTHMNYPGFQSSSMQQNQQNRSRLRSSSASLPLGLDLRNQYRSVGSGHNMPSSAHSPGPRANTTSAMNAVTSSYTASFPSAPLTAPIDFSLPRTPGYRSSGAEYSMPQMSAPIAPPNDFSQAFQASMSSSNARTPIREGFGQTPTSAAERGGGGDDYAHHDSLGLSRKRSHTGPSPPGGGSHYSSATQ